MSSRPSKQDAERCRQLARDATDERTRRILFDLAAEHEALSRGDDREDLDQGHPASRQHPGRSDHAN